MYTEHNYSLRINWRYRIYATVIKILMKREIFLTVISIFILIWQVFVVFNSAFSPFSRIFFFISFRFILSNRKFQTIEYKTWKWNFELRVYEYLNEQMNEWINGSIDTNEWLSEEKNEILGTWKTLIGTNICHIYCTNHMNYGSNSNASNNKKQAKRNPASAYTTRIWCQKVHLPFSIHEIAAVVRAPVTPYKRINFIFVYIRIKQREKMFVMWMKDK